MTSTVFVSGTVIASPWLNDVNEFVYNGAGKPLKIAIIGDSMVTQNEMDAESVSHQLERVINQMGQNVKVFPFGRDAHTFYRANTTAYINGQTSVQACIAANPKIVLVALGLNDSITNVDGRTLAQTKTDADTLFAALKAGLPTAKIYYVAEVPYDTVNFTPSTLKNKGVIPYMQTLRTSGILTGYYTTEILDDACSSATKTLYQNWADLNTYVKANANITGSYDFKLWRVARMGGAGPSGLHLNVGGNLLATAYFAEGLRAVSPEFASFFSNNFDIWEKPDTLFSTMLTASGDGYTYTPTSLTLERDAISYKALRPNTWHLPLDAGISATASIDDSGDSVYTWSVQGAAPNKGVSISVNGAAFVAVGSMLTTADGHWTESATGAYLTSVFTVGANTVRYAVDNICFSPITVTYSAQAIIWIAPTFTGTWSNYTLFVPPSAVAGYRIDHTKRVWLQGVIGGGTTGTSAFTLPVGYRPPATMTFPVLASNALGYVQVFPNGTVVPTATTTTAVSLDSLNFSTV